MFTYVLQYPRLYSISFVVFVKYQKSSQKMCKNVKLQNFQSVRFSLYVIFSKCFVKGVKNHKSATNHKGMSHGNAAASIEVAF